MDIINNVIKAMDGDQEAISELYYTTYPKLRAVAVSILKNEDDADDIVQDSYIKAFSSLHQLDNAKKFEPWLCRIVSNKCKDYLKKNKPILFSSQDNEENDEPIEWSIEDESKEYNPEEVLLSADTRKQIMDLLDSLPDDQRICLVYHVVQEMKISEIAELLEVSESTVKSRINYAKSKMKVKINELEKKGVKLRGFAGFALFPFIRHLFSSQSASIPPISAEVVTGSVTAAAETTDAISETVASSTSAVIGETTKTVVGQAVQHLGLKIISGVVAVAIAATTITGIVNPKLLYPIDVFNIIEEAPIKVIEKFEDAFNDGELDKMVECLEPNVQEEINEYKYEADGFIGIFLNTDSNKIVKIASSLLGAKCDIVVDKKNSDIKSDVAILKTKIKFSILGKDDESEEAVTMKKIDGKWYIAHSEHDLEVDSENNDKAIELYESLLRNGVTENDLEIAYYAYIDLNNDGIYELLVSDAQGTSDNWSTGELFTYKNDKLYFCGRTNSRYDYFYIVNNSYLLGRHRMGNQFISLDKTISTTNYHWDETMQRNDPAISYNDGEWEYLTNEEFEFYQAMPDNNSVEDAFIKTAEPIILKQNSFAEN